MMTRLVRCATALAAAAALAGCAETEPGESDSFGSLAAAVTATGTDGATYRLPAGTYVQVWNDTFYDYWSMDGDMNILSVEVPVGDYYVALGHSNGYTIDWPLDRENPDATTETVNGTLITPQPVSVTVTEGNTSSLVFQFQVVNGGTVTFAHGLIDFSIDVNEAESTVGRMTFSGTYTKDAETFGPTSPPSSSPWSTRSAPASSTRSWSTWSATGCRPRATRPAPPPRSSAAPSARATSSWPAKPGPAAPPPGSASTAASTRRTSS